MTREDKLDIYCILLAVDKDEITERQKEILEIMKREALEDLNE